MPEKNVSPEEPMSECIFTRRRYFRATALVAAFLGGLFVFGAGAATAGEFLINSPPPMPESMKKAPSTQVLPTNAMPVGIERRAYINDEKVSVREFLGRDAGFAVPDTDGGLVWVPAPANPISAGQADARELRLKIRELASQLIANMDPSLRGTVALPTSFVNQEDFSQSSALGRFISEQLFHEFNQRGYPVKEFRLAPVVTVREGEGEFLLSRKISTVPTGNANNVFVVGTYFVDRQAVFVNARLVRGNGTVLRTAQIIMNANGMARRMLAGGGKSLQSGSLPIEDYKTRTQPTNLTPFDQGEDIH